MAPVRIDDSLDVSYSDAVSFLCRCRYYNPHKKMHSLKAQIVCTWRGEIVCVDYHNMPSPTLRRGMPGGRHDTYYWRVSTAEALRDLTLRPHQRILGDTGYPRVDEDGNVIMIIPEKMSVLRNIPPEHAESRDARKHRNYTIGSVRVVVEGVFGAVKNLWTLYGRKAIGSIEHDQHARGFAVACALYSSVSTPQQVFPGRRLDEPRSPMQRLGARRAVRRQPTGYSGRGRTRGCNPRWWSVRGRAHGCRRRVTYMITQVQDDSILVWPLRLAFFIIVRVICESFPQVVK